MECPRCHQVVIALATHSCPRQCHHVHRQSDRQCERTTAEGKLYCCAAHEADRQGQTLTCECA